MTALTTDVRAATPARVDAPSPKSLDGVTIAAPEKAQRFDAPELELGSATAPTTIVEYLSVTCSHCAAFERDTWPQVERAWVRTGLVRFIVREMPTAPVAVSAAGFLLARCAGPARYWDVVQSMLSRQTEILQARDLQAALAQEQKIAGLTDEAARVCLSDDSAIDAINARRQAGLDVGVDSTPYFLINGKPLAVGERLSGERYEGGELSFDQLAQAIRRRSASGRQPH